MNTKKEEEEDNAEIINEKKNKMITKCIYYDQTITKLFTVCVLTEIYIIFSYRLDKKYRMLYAISVYCCFCFTFRFCLCIFAQNQNQTHTNVSETSINGYAHVRTINCIRCVSLCTWWMIKHMRISVPSMYMCKHFLIFMLIQKCFIRCLFQWIMII